MLLSIFVKHLQKLIRRFLSIQSIKNPLNLNSRDFGAANQIWTGDLVLTKDALYRLSHSSIWRPGWGSNPRPLAWQASVLTNWTTRPYNSQRSIPSATLFIITGVPPNVNTYLKKFFLSHFTGLVRCISIDSFILISYNAFIERAAFPFQQTPFP